MQPSFSTLFPAPGFSDSQQSAVSHEVDRGGFEEDEGGLRALVDTMTRFEKALAPRIALLDLSTSEPSSVPAGVAD
jgi:hypothetical protein